MTYRLSNPLRAVWRYMRGDDLTEANARAIALAQAARASGASAGAATAMPGTTVAAPPSAAAVDRRRM